MALASWLERLDHVSSYATKKDGEDHKWHSLISLTLERVPAVPLTFGTCSKVNKWISSPYSLGAL